MKRIAFDSYRFIRLITSDEHLKDIKGVKFINEQTRHTEEVDMHVAKSTSTL